VNVLVVGGGGREHAIVKALRRSGADVFAAMGNQNPGIRKAAKDVLVHDASDVPTVVAWAKARGVDLAVIGPEDPCGEQPPITRSAANAADKTRILSASMRSNKIGL